jgi:hypothetical protein
MGAGTKRARWARVAAAAACAAVAWTAHAQSVSDATIESLTSRAAAVAPSAPASAPVVWNARRWSVPVAVIELPAEQPFGPPKRKHHALTWRNDALSRALNNAGWAEADCHQRVRLPSRWRPSSAQTGHAGAEVQLQVAVGCSF